MVVPKYSSRDPRRDPTKIAVSPSQAIFIAAYTLAIDVFIYSVTLSLIGTYLSSSIAKMFSLPPTCELILTILITFSIVYVGFLIFGEASYWNDLFAMRAFYFNLLNIRDVTNAAVFGVALIGLAHSVDAMISDRAVKSIPVGEGASYFCIKTLLAYFHMDKNIIKELGLKLPHRGGITDPDFGENSRFEHGGAFMFYWAVLASACAKVVYFNTLYTYVRAIEVFMSLKPIFNDDDEEGSGGGCQVPADNQAASIT